MNGIVGMLTLAEGQLEPDYPAMQYLTKAEKIGPPEAFSDAASRAWQYQSFYVFRSVQLLFFQDCRKLGVCRKCRSVI